MMRQEGSTEVSITYTAMFKNNTADPALCLVFPIAIEQLSGMLVPVFRLVDYYHAASALVL
jgi:hypothetical protein